MRIVTLSAVMSLGVFGCLVLLGGLALGFTPFEPPSGVSFEEHMHRIDAGYYTIEGWKKLGVMSAYLVVVAIPHRWIIRSRLVFVVVIAVLALPLFAFVGDLGVAIIKKWPDKAALIELAHPINLAFDSVCILFCAMIPLSLFFSWTVRPRGEVCLPSTT